MVTAAICLWAGGAAAEAAVISPPHTIACGRAAQAQTTVNSASPEAPTSRIGVEGGCGFGWLLPTGGRERERPTGRRAKHLIGAGGHEVNSGGRLSWFSTACRRWAALLLGLALAWAGARPVAAQQPVRPIAEGTWSTGPAEPSAAGGRAGSEAAPAHHAGGPNASGARPASSRRRQAGGGFAKSRGTYEGETFPRAPYWGSPNVITTDPAQYPRPRSLDNDDPNSFWYTHRPNIFNQPVEAEWDFYNIINTDRPDFTDAVYTVGKGVTFSENGYTVERINDAATHLRTQQLPESLIRYGVTNEFELRMKWNGFLLADSEDLATRTHTQTRGGEDLDLGFKYEIWQQRDWRPMFTVDGGLLLPTGTGGQQNAGVQPHFNLLAGWGFRRWVYLKWQTGSDFPNVKSPQQLRSVSSVPGFVTVNAGRQSWHESLSLLTQWTKRVGAFHEWFMISNIGGGDTRARHFLDMGLYLYATPNIQFDVRVGQRLSNRVDEYFTGGGLSARW